LLRAAIIKQLLTNEISFGLIKVQFGKEIFTRCKIAPSGSTIPKPNGKEFAFLPVCQTILAILAFGIWYLDFGIWNFRLHQKLPIPLITLFLPFS
jgi:hypothetical protein